MEDLVPSAWKITLTQNSIKQVTEYLKWKKKSLKKVSSVSVIQSNVYSGAGGRGGLEMNAHPLSVLYLASYFISYHFTCHNWTFWIFLKLYDLFIDLHENITDEIYIHFND